MELRQTFPVLTLCLLPTFIGCGGSGGSSSGTNAQSSSQASIPTQTKAVAGAATATAAAGKTTATPVAAATGVTNPDTPTPAPPSILAVRPGGSIVAALRIAPAGTTVAVAPGTYAPFALQAGDLLGPVTLVADVTGQLTESPQAPVVITANSPAVAAVQLSGVTGLTMDGFTLDGGSEEALLIINSPQTTIRNCIVRGSDGDGIFVERSDQTVVFNNLIFDNRSAGLRVYGTFDLQAINNTVYGNHDNGVSVGDAQEPSDSVTILNNIVNTNRPAGIAVDATTTGYNGNFNLNTDGYGPDTPIGRTDFAANPMFIDPHGGDFHLAQGSPAVDVGDVSIDADSLITLQLRTTQTDNSPDLVPVDLGYHYPTPLPTPTPVPRATRARSTPTSLPPHTPTPTPPHTPTPTRVGG